MAHRHSISRTLTVQSLESRIAPACPVGPEFRVNTWTTNAQYEPAIAIDSDGDYVVTWQSLYQDATRLSIYAQRYSANGVPQGPEFRVNSTTLSGSNPTVAMDSDGDFVIAWQRSEFTNSLYDVYARRYSANGVALGNEFRVNTYTTQYQQIPAVAMNASGDFVVVWQSHGQDGSGSGVYGQRYDSTGMPVGVEFRANSHTNDGQIWPAIAMNAIGDFVVVWESWYATGMPQDGSLSGVYGQRFSASGQPVGAEFRANTYTTNEQEHPTVCMDAAGNFVVAWSGSGVGDTEGIFAQRYDPNGVVVGTEFRANTYTTSTQRFPTASADSSGQFVIGWEGRGPNQVLSSSAVYARVYNSAGVAQSAEFKVNTYTTSSQDWPAVAMDSDGDFVFTWRSGVFPPYQDGDEQGVFGQRFAGSVPTISSVRVNDGSLQRSRVTSLTVTMSDAVTYPNGIASAFQVQRTGPGTPTGLVSLAAAPAGNSVTLTFGAGGTVGIDPGASLIDGSYQLRVVASSIVGDCGLHLDGNNDGIPGDDFLTPANGAGAIFRLFGDVDGNRSVDVLDFGAFRQAFGTNVPAFDFDGGGAVDVFDFGQFRQRFGSSV